MNQQGKLLITGANGFTGQHACKHFLEAGYNLTLVTRNESTISQNVQLEQCDLRDKFAVNKLIEKAKPDYLLHLAGQNHVGDSWLNPIDSLEVNSFSTAYLIEAIRTVNPDCKIVVTGSALQYDPASIASLTHPYSLSKTLQAIISQAWSILYNMDIVLAKPTNLIGPGFSNGICSLFARKIVDMEEGTTSKVLEVENVLTMRDFLDVRDAVSAYEILLTKGKPGETYEIATGNNRTLGEIINEYRALTPIEFEIHSRVNVLKEQQLTITPTNLYALGWKPVYQIQSSLKDILNFHRKNR